MKPAEELRMTKHLEEHERVGDLPHLLHRTSSNEKLGCGRAVWVLRAHGIVATAYTRKSCIRKHGKAHRERKAERR